MNKPLFPPPSPIDYSGHCDYPGQGDVERSPGIIDVRHGEPFVMPRPHWHAQVEVNFCATGAMHYQMTDHGMTLRAGEVALFWGGFPHCVFETDPGTQYTVMHLPLVHFFRLRLSHHVRQRLMEGASFRTAARDPGDPALFARLAAWLTSDDENRRRVALDEVLLRAERLAIEPYIALGGAGEGRASEPHGNAGDTIDRICIFVARNFREPLCADDIAAAAKVHPKYAMSLFRQSTGMTLNSYITLLRLSYAQALLADRDRSVLSVALEAGFGSLSAFQKAFRLKVGKTPSAFRKGAFVGQPLHA